MKKILSILLILSISILFVSCDKKELEIEKEYTIQYVDDFGQHKITVKSGEAYSLDVLPEKNGYVFAGLYDAEVGGTQYVNEKGSALSVFTDNKNLILFPQFKPKEYTLVLDYQGANVTGSRSMKVEYESSISQLPMNLTLENKEFTGWYTKPNCEGKQIADKYGVIPVVNQIIENNFDLSNNKGYIYLYAGFKGKEYTVTFYAQENNSPEEIKVEHGTPISEVVPSTRVNGQAVLSWSKTKGGEVFNGKITDDMTLYAVEYAPYIELDCNGGMELNSIVARAGSTIYLPIPTKDLASFSHWEDMNGYEYTSTTMPENSISLKAIWNPKIVFDENGGSDVEDISTAIGKTIELPLPKKDGFIFAGWYNEDREQYTSNIMPSIGIKLKAGWYSIKQSNITLIENNVDKKIIVSTNSLSTKQRIKIDLSDIFPSVPDSGIQITYNINFRWGNTYKKYSATGQIALYEGSDLSTSYELSKKNLSHDDAQESYMYGTLSAISTIHNNILFLYYAGEGAGRMSLTGLYGYDVAFYDIFIEIFYPDTTNLYL